MQIYMDATNSPSIGYVHDLGLESDTVNLDLSKLYFG